MTTTCIPLKWRNYSIDLLDFEQSVKKNELHNSTVVLDFKLTAGNLWRMAVQSRAINNRSSAEYLMEHEPVRVKKKYRKVRTN